MKLVTYLIAALLGFFGVMFIVAGAGDMGWLTIVVGVILMVGAGGLIYLTQVRPQKTETTMIQKIDLSGDVNLEQMKCRNCGGTLDRDALEVKAGAIFVNCPYCGATYQIEEAPKW